MKQSASTIAVAWLAFKLKQPDRGQLIRHEHVEEAAMQGRSGPQMCADELRSAEADACIQSMMVRGFLVMIGHN